MNLSNVPQSKLLGLLSRTGSREWAAYLRDKDSPLGDMGTYQRYMTRHRVFHRVIKECVRRGETT